MDFFILHTRTAKQKIPKSHLALGVSIIMYCSVMQAETNSAQYAVDCRRKPLEFKHFPWACLRFPLEWNVLLLRSKPLPQ